MNANATNKKEALDGDQKSLVLSKIHRLIDSSDPDAWRSGGEALSATATFLKPRRTWEQVFTQAIEKGTLVFRKCTPIKSEFKGRGFIFVPMARAQFTVELRAVGWHHSELTDPERRSQHSDRSCTVLAEGDIAEELFAHVQEMYATYHNSRQVEFEREVELLIRMLPERLEEQSVDTFERSEEIPGEVHFSSIIDDYTVDVYRVYVGERETYGVKVARRQQIAEIKDAALCKEVFHAVEDLGQTSRLLTLSKALETL